jgi:hypothetical protein
VRGVAAETEKGAELWVCNPSPNPLKLRLPDGFSHAALLDASFFSAASRNPGLLDGPAPLPTQTISLDAYAIVRATDHV